MYRIKSNICFEWHFYHLLEVAIIRCPLPYEEVLEDIIKAFGQNDVGISKK